MFANFCHTRAISSSLARTSGSNLPLDHNLVFNVRWYWSVDFTNASLKSRKFCILYLALIPHHQFALRPCVTQLNQHFPNFGSNRFHIMPLYCRYFNRRVRSAWSVAWARYNSTSLWYAGLNVRLIHSQTDFGTEASICAAMPWDMCGVLCIVSPICLLDKKRPAPFERWSLLINEL